MGHCCSCEDESEVRIKKRTMTETELAHLESKWVDGLPASELSIMSPPKFKEKENQRHLM